MSNSMELKMSVKLEGKKYDIFRMPAGNFYIETVDDDGNRKTVSGDEALRVVRFYKNATGLR